MVSDINSGIMFSLLPMNVVFMAMGMYNLENVFYFSFSNGF